MKETLALISLSLFTAVSVTAQSKRDRIRARVRHKLSAQQKSSRLMRRKRHCRSGTSPRGIRQPHGRNAVAAVLVVAAAGAAVIQAEATQEDAIRAVAIRAVAGFPTGTADLPEEALVKSRNTKSSSLKIRC